MPELSGPSHHLQPPPTIQCPCWTCQRLQFSRFYTEQAVRVDCSLHQTSRASLIGQALASIDPSTLVNTLQRPLTACLFAPSPASLPIQTHHLHFISNRNFVVESKPSELPPLLSTSSALTTLQPSSLQSLLGTRLDPDRVPPPRVPRHNRAFTIRPLLNPQIATTFRLSHTYIAYRRRH